MGQNEALQGKSLEVTDLAITRLSSWGLSAGTIHDLFSLTSSFDYSAQGNTKRITNLYSKSIDGIAVIVVAGIFDPLGIGPGGDCDSIASHFHFSAESSGLVEQIRNESTKNLLFVKEHGRSRDFFAKPSDFHVWNMLVPKGKEIGPQAFHINPSEGVVFDASFQEVSTIPENGYKTLASVGVEKSGVSLAVYADPEIRRGYIDPAGKVLGIRSDCGGAFPVLGMSTSKRFVYSLLFVNAEGTIVPVLGSIRADSKTNQAFYLNPKTGEVCSPERKRDPLQPEEEAEIKEILAKISSIPILPAPEDLSPTELIVKPFS